MAVRHTGDAVCITQRLVDEAEKPQRRASSEHHLPFEWCVSGRLNSVAGLAGSILYGW